jgi:hypothetical protein
MAIVQAFPSGEPPSWSCPLRSPAATPGATRRLKSCGSGSSTGLTRFEDLVVLGPTGTLPVSAPAGTIAADYVLQGTVHAIGADLHIFVLLIEPRQNRYVWADTLDRPLAEGGDAVVDAAAGQIVRELAQPYGAIFVDKVRTAGTQSPERVPEE